MTATPLQRRAERRARNQSHVDMNLVALIDIFTILIFFLLSSATGVELLSSPKAVQLPSSSAEQPPRPAVVVVVTPQDILVDGRVVAQVGDVMQAETDIVAPLQAALQELAPAAATATTAAAGAAAAPRAVTILGDKDIPYRLLRKLMLTCARADFTDVAFAVRQQPRVSS